HPRPQTIAANGQASVAGQKTPVATKSPSNLNKWQKTDIFLSKHRKIILTVIAVGLLVAVLGIVYYSFRGTTIRLMGTSLGDGTNAIVLRDVTLREGATSASNDLGYLTKGAKLHVVKAVGSDPDDWNGSWLEVDVIDWASGQPGSKGSHGY